jgi:hypothetical protein
MFPEMVSQHNMKLERKQCVQKKSSLFNLFNNALSMARGNGVYRKMVVYEVGRMWSLPILKNYCSTCLDGLRKTMKNLGQNPASGLYSKPRPSPK